MLKTVGKVLFSGGLESPKFTAEDSGVSLFHIIVNLCPEINVFFCAARCSRNVQLAT